MELPVPDTPMARLEPLVGDWILEADFGSGAVRGQAEFEWILSGRYLLERSEIPHAPDSVAIVSLDADGRSFAQHYFDSRGVTRLYAMTFERGAWTLLRTAADFSPLSFAQRYVGQLSSDGSTIEGRWETSPDGGATWRHDFDLVHRRA
jgi:hypothetical protein